MLATSVLSTILLGWMLHIGSPNASVSEAWRLEWSAPPGCPSAAEVELLVERWRRSAPPSLPPARVRARGRVAARDGGGFVLSLELTTDDTVTNHEEHADACDVLAEATALQVAMAMGFLGDAASEPDDAPAPIVPAPPEQTDVVEPAPRTPAPEPSTRSTSNAGVSSEASTAAPRRRRSRDLGGALRVQGGVGTGRVPRIDGRLGIAGALRWPRARIDLVVAHTFLQTRPHPSREGLSLRVWQWTTQLRGCWTPQVGPVELPVCGGVEAGASRATSRGVPVRRNATSPFIAGVVGAAVAWPFTRRLALWIGVDGWLAVTQPAFTVQTLAPWFTTRRGGVDGVVGFELRLP